MTLWSRFQIALCLTVWAIILAFVVISVAAPKTLQAIVEPIVQLVLQQFWR